MVCLIYEAEDGNGPSHMKVPFIIECPEGKSKCQ